MSETKLIWKSRTLWINILAVAVVLFTDLEGFLGTGADITIMAIVNIFLRAITKSGVTLTN